MNDKTCSRLEHGLAFELNSICDCCINHGTNFYGKPLIIDNYQGQIPDWDEVFKIKHDRVSQNEIDSILECNGCYMYGKGHINDFEKYIEDISIDQIKLCNSRCIYCGEDYRLNPDYYDVYPVIKDLIEKGYFRNTGTVTFQGGEPTIMRDFDKLLVLFNLQKTQSRIHSSAIKFSQSILDGIKSGLVSVVISLDAGTKDTHKLIKQVDSFDKVCENITKYASVLNDSNKENLVLKYIIIPGINDSVKEIDSFFNIVKSNNVRTIAMDIEVQYARKNNQQASEHIYMLMDYIREYSKKCNLHLLEYSFIQAIDVERKNFKYKKFVNNKFIYEIIIDYYKKKNQLMNVEYKK